MSYKSKNDLICDIENNAIKHAHNVFNKAKRNNDPKVIREAYKIAGLNARLAVYDKNQYKAAYYGKYIDTLSILLGFKKS